MFQCASDVEFWHRLPPEESCPEVYVRYSLGYRLNHYVKIPAEFCDPRRAFHQIKTDGLGSRSRNLRPAEWEVRKC